MRFYVLIAVIFFMAAGASEADSADRTQSVRDIYTLGSGDRVKVTVYGEDDLSGVRELEKKVVTKLANGYLRKPRVSIEVTNYRPFYILGEVKRPGSYAYVEGMKIVNAVAMSGGFTYRARKQRFLVRRAGAPKDSETEAKPDDLLYPGDVIRVPERFF